jgi:predicted DNA-binding protein (MmcQ/YjbR family)
MRTLDQFNVFCASLPAATHVVQWGGADVWKVGGKVFAIGSCNDGALAVTFKVSPMAFEILKNEPGLRGAPYLASRGLLWIQHYAAPGLADAELKSHIRASYDMIAASLSRRKRQELGIG